MLPNFRVIFVAFVCGFALVFSGLRMVVSSRAAQMTVWSSPSEPVSAPSLAAAVVVADRGAAPAAAEASTETFETRFVVETPAAAVPQGLTLHAKALADAKALALADAKALETRVEQPAPVQEPQAEPTKPADPAATGSAASAQPAAVAPVPQQPAAAPADKSTNGAASRAEMSVPPPQSATPETPLVVALLAPAEAAVPVPAPTLIPAPAEVAVEPAIAAPVEPVKIAALPEPQESSNPPAGGDDITASIRQEHNVPVPTAGTSQPLPMARPVAAIERHAKLQTVRAKKPVAKPRKTVSTRPHRRIAAIKEIPAQPGPFPLFGAIPSAATTR